MRMKQAEMSTILGACQEVHARRKQRRRRRHVRSTKYVDIDRLKTLSFIALRFEIIACPSLISRQLSYFGGIVWF